MTIHDMPIVGQIRISPEREWVRVFHIGVGLDNRQQVQYTRAWENKNEVFRKSLVDFCRQYPRIHQKEVQNV